MTVENGAILSVALRGQGLTGNYGLMVFHALCAFDAPVANGLVAADMETALRANFTGFLPYISSTWNFIDVYTFDLTTGNPVGTAMVNPAWNSAPSRGPAECSPPGVAYLAKFPTGFGKSVGKKFIFGVPEVNISNGLLSGTPLTQLGLLAARFLSTSLISGTSRAYSWGVAKKLGPLTFEFRAYISATADSQVAYQRRRKWGVGG